MFSDNFGGDYSMSIDGSKLAIAVFLLLRGTPFIDESSTVIDGLSTVVDGSR